MARPFNIRRRRAGLAPIDVIVGLVVVLVVVLFALMALPRSRETARLASCRRNLAQIGQALLSYHDLAGGLPFVAAPIATDRPIDGAPASPQKAMLDALGVSDFLGVDVLKQGAPRSSATVPVGGEVAGFLCPSDAASFGRFDAPISYRANVGAEFDGADGPFAPGRPMNLREVERRDGAAFTAAFAERLLGDGLVRASSVNYRLVPAIDAAPTDGDWRGDAGSTWLPADFRHTLYSHAKPPGAGPSRVVRDGRSSTMGASSAHVEGVVVLMLDGSARVVAPTIDAGVWRAMGSIGPEPPADASTRE